MWVLPSPFSNSTVIVLFRFVLESFSFLMIIRYQEEINLVFCLIDFPAKKWLQFFGFTVLPVESALVSGVFSVEIFRFLGKFRVVTDKTQINRRLNHLKFFTCSIHIWSSSSCSFIFRTIRVHEYRLNTVMACMRFTYGHFLSGTVLTVFCFW